MRVTAKVYCSEAGRTPDWSIAVIHPPGDYSNYLQLTRCGSVRGEISLLLPPGKYDFDVYSESPDARLRRPRDRQGSKSAAARLLGGKVLKPKISIAPHGWRAVVLDSEGNRFALHSS